MFMLLNDIAALTCDTVCYKLSNNLLLTPTLARFIGLLASISASNVPEEKIFSSLKLIKCERSCVKGSLSGFSIISKILFKR